MILTAYDIESLSRSLSHWEWGEYISEAFVIIACAGELVADLEASWLTEKRKKHLQRRSTILLVAALSVSLICLVRTNQLSGSVIGSLGDKADDANKKANTALTDSGTALAQSNEAETKSGDAKSSAKIAEGTVGSVKKEADDLLQKYLETSREVAKYAWRTVSPEQLRILRHQLQTVQGGRIVVRWETVDPEQDNFGRQLSDALEKAGLGLSRVSGAMISGGDFTRRIAPPLSLEDVTRDNSDLERVLANALVIASLAKYPVPARPPGGVIIGGDDLKVVVGPRSPN